MSIEIFLKGSSKYKLYDNLNKPDESKSYCKYCLSKKSIFSKFSENLNELCCLFARNLIELNTKIQGEDENNERCRYFNFWINDQLKKKISATIKNSTHRNYIRLQFLQVFFKIKSHSLHNDCSYEYDQNVDLDLWEKWKNLYDFINNYNHIKNLVIHDYNLCQKYPSYLSYIEEVYNNYKNECCNTVSRKCPFSSGFKDWCNQKDFLNILTCAKTNAVSETFTHEGRNEGSMEQQGTGITYIAKNSQLERSFSESGETLTTKSDYYSKLGIGFSFLTILPTFFYLYKFTTFGNWIRFKVLKHNINIKPGEDANTLMTQELNNEDENIYNDGYNITYHPS
ncbi:PIR Superfamily Protein [Plasmodium ovale wallikeri]|uniref:PIR Superfamily Protein n=1 Tax=Plasmodium ovale wallikeri TaxID=864142 RepID=A0A1A9AEW7_PLAOA|nr:PIR Superfamily Protein [Plasmodium ovale wallikeri]